MADSSGGLLADPRAWYLIAFVIFIGIVFKPIGKAITGGLDDHSKKVKEQLEEAKKLREEAQDLLATYEGRHRDAEAEAEKIIARAKAEADILREQATEQLAKDATAREKQLASKVALMKAQALQDVRQQAADLALTVTEQLLRENQAANQKMALEAAIHRLPELKAAS